MRWMRILPVLKQSKRSRFKKVVKNSISESPEKNGRKGSGASEETLREAVLQRARSPNDSQGDQKSATNSSIGFALVKDIHIVDAANDSEVVRDFKDLESIVKQGSSAFVRPVPDQIRTLNAGDTKRLKLIAPGIAFPEGLQALIHYPGDRRQVAKGYVYRILYERVFSVHHRRSTGPVLPNCTDLWILEDAAKAVSSLERIFRNEVETVHEHDKPGAVDAAAHITEREYQTWRSYTMSLLSRTCVTIKDPSSSVFEKQSSEILQAIWEVLGTWLPASEHAPTREGLGRIITKAIKIMQLLRMQRAYWTIAYPDWHPIRTPPKLLFNPLTMVDRGTNQGGVGEIPQESLRNRTVELVIRPALFKRGDASGNKFDVESCPVRAEVQCQKY
jgi:hypothetical protein